MMFICEHDVWIWIWIWNLLSFFFWIRLMEVRLHMKKINKCVILHQI